MSAIGRLKDMALADLQRRYPAVPLKALVVYNYRQDSANGLTRCIIDWLRFCGHQAERVNTMGVYRIKKNVAVDVIGRARTLDESKWVPGTATRGSADIHATVNGRSVKIEVKYGRDRLSEAQKEYGESVMRAGGLYWVVGSLDEFEKYYNEII